MTALLSDEIAATALRAMRTYASGDHDAFMALLPDDVVYALYLDEAQVPFAGETRGKALMRERIDEMHRAFEYVLFRPFGVRVEGNVSHNQVEFMYRHRVSGEMLNGRFRLVVRFEGNIIRRIEEYHDAERVNAFMRLVGGV
jgi:ketosteroid isomerase-like protein